VEEAMKKMLRSIGLAAGLFALAAAPASAQFTHYVALGDSLTAGIEGSCLVQRNQLASFPAVLAHQLGQADFQQPLVQELALTSPLVGPPCLGAVLAGSSITVGPISQMGPPLNSLLARPYDNLGIPGADVGDLVNLTHGNPSGNSVERFSALVLRNVPGSPFDGLNAVTEANLLSPDLITLWIGSNDILTAATTGVFLPGVTATPPDVFAENYAAVLDNIALPGRTIVAGNVPDVTAIPFTTTVPSRLTIPGGTTPVLGPGNDAFPCVPVAPDHGCPVPDGTLVTLPASALLAQGIGVPVALGGTGNPLPDGTVQGGVLIPGFLLYPNEIAGIEEYIAAYNQTIEEDIAGVGGVVVEINEIFDDFTAHGYHIGGITLTSAFLRGGIFSADGVHPSNIGYTIVADAFIQTMNAELHLEIPRPDFNHVLFTPNVPATGAGVRGGGEWSYSIGMWRDLLERIGAARGLTIQMPDALGTAAPRGGPRRVARD
jgi:lysophospholipase L1-like esterase